MAISFVQGAQNSSTTGTTVATFSSSTTQGNLLVASIALNGGDTNAITSMVDSKGNVWQQAITPISNGAGGIGLVVYYTYNISGGSSHSLTLNWDALLSSRISLAMHEYSGLEVGVKPLDNGGGTTGSSTSPNSGAIALTAVTPYLVIGANGRMGNGSSVVTAGAGYSNLTTTTSAAEASIESKIVILGLAGTQTATFSLSISRAWACAVVIFKGVSDLPVSYGALL